MLSFSNFVLSEDVKKNQIKTLFSNFDFKVGLEFEFFNEDFIEKNEMPSPSSIIVLDALSDELQDFTNLNRIIISDNLKGEAKKDLFGWHVILKQQGYQDPHIHPSGWLSGVIYLKVVPSLEKNEGAIEFSLNAQNYSDSK